MPLIEYIGDKPQGRRDTVNHGSTTVWTHKGDVRWVPDGHEVGLLKHPNVWRVGKTYEPAPILTHGIEVAAPDQAPAENPSLEVSGFDPLAGKTDDEVRAIARSIKSPVDKRLGGERLRGPVREQLLKLV